MTEEQRLGTLYAGFGDEQLMGLARDAGNLTPVALAALTAEAQGRGLRLPGVTVSEDVLSGHEPVSVTAHNRGDGFGVGVPGFFPGAGPAVEQALEPSGETRAGMTALVTLYDGLELSRACQALAAAGIAPAIEELAGDAVTGSATRYEVWVNAAAVEQGRQVLRAQMGLFPEGEVEGGDLAEGDGMVGQFDSENEAGEMLKVLADAGIPARLQQESGTWLLSVEPFHHERALDLLAGQFEL